MAKTVHGRFSVQNNLVGEVETITPRKFTPKSRSKTGYIGVCKKSRGDGYRSNINISGSQLCTYRGLCKIEAATKRDAIAFEWFGFESLLNFPEKHKSTIEVKSTEEYIHLESYLSLKYQKELNFISKFVRTIQ